MIRSCWSMMSLMFSVSLLIFCLVFLSTFEIGMLKSPARIVDFSLSPSSSIIFVSHVCSSIVWCTCIQDLLCFLDWSFYHYIISVSVSGNFIRYEAYFILYQRSHFSLLINDYISFPILLIYLCHYIWKEFPVDSR